MWVLYISFITKQTHETRVPWMRVPEASGACDGCDRSDNLVLANSWDASAITRIACVALISQMVNILCKN